MVSGTLTPSGLSLASGPIFVNNSLVLGILITPSMIACATCTPWGPNSFARLWLSALSAHLPVENELSCALDLTEAVAPVKISEGGYWGLLSTPLRRRGRVAWEKLTPPIAETEMEAEKASEGVSRNGFRTKPPEALKMAACTCCKYTNHANGLPSQTCDPG
jgi:hypothetical protein